MTKKKDVYYGYSLVIIHVSSCNRRCVLYSTTCWSYAMNTTRSLLMLSGEKKKKKEKKADASQWLKYLSID